MIWTEPEKVIVRDFLQTSAGQKLLESIARPATDRSNLERAALSGAYADGIDKVKQMILSIAYASEVIDLDAGLFLTWSKDNQ